MQMSPDNDLTMNYSIGFKLLTLTQFDFKPR